MQPAIRIENLGKCYRVAKNRDRSPYRTFRETLTDAAMAPIRRAINRGMEGHLEEFWALKDVSFEVQPGEVVGIIGRNGAGKSTLLKILSRITKPTKGRIEINGRVGSLLEVGTGFHPELTGRENIYLNGSILGMTRPEIRRKFDEIVEFSGVEQFLDTPVKRYSSGMYVRLAFAVAAHLEPEILIVDEVLAVGDAEFQKKCLGKMGEVAKSGRTVLFVSHNMNAVSALCSSGVLLEKGQLRSAASVDSTLAMYKSNIIENENLPTIVCHSSLVEIQSLKFAVNSDNISLIASLVFMSNMSDIGIGFEIKEMSGLIVSSQGAIHSGILLRDTRMGAITAELSIKNLLCHLNGGDYQLNIWFSRPGTEKLVSIENAGMFHVESKDPSGTGKGLVATRNGLLFVEAELNTCSV